MSVGGSFQSCSDPHIFISFWRKCNKKKKKNCLTISVNECLVYVYRVGQQQQDSTPDRGIFRLPLAAISPLPVSQYSAVASPHSVHVTSLPRPYDSDER